jgi:hypothetical protein
VTEGRGQSHNIIIKLNSCSYNYIGVRVRLGFVGQRGEVRVKIVKLSTPCKTVMFSNWHAFSNLTTQHTAHKIGMGSRKEDAIVI